MASKYLPPATKLMAAATFIDAAFVDILEMVDAEEEEEWDYFQGMRERFGKTIKGEVLMALLQEAHEGGEAHED